MKQCNKGSTVKDNQIGVVEMKKYFRYIATNDDYFTTHQAYEVIDDTITNNKGEKIVLSDSTYRYCFIEIKMQNSFKLNTRV